jgi:hypothetical protein
MPAGSSQTYPVVLIAIARNADLFYRGAKSHRFTPEVIKEMSGILAVPPLFHSVLTCTKQMT